MILIFCSWKKIENFKFILTIISQKQRKIGLTCGTRIHFYPFISSVVRLGSVCAVSEYHVCKQWSFLISDKICPFHGETRYNLSFCHIHRLWRRGGGFNGAISGSIVLDSFVGKTSKRRFLVFFQLGFRGSRGMKYGGVNK